MVGSPESVLPDVLAIHTLEMIPKSMILIFVVVVVCWHFSARVDVSETITFCVVLKNHCRLEVGVRMSSLIYYVWKLIHAAVT